MSRITLHERDDITLIVSKIYDNLLNMIFFGRYSFLKMYYRCISLQSNPIANPESYNQNQSIFYFWVRFKDHLILNGVDLSALHINDLQTKFSSWGFVTGLITLHGWEGVSKATTVTGFDESDIIGGVIQIFRYLTHWTAQFFSRHHGSL